MDQMREEALMPETKPAAVASTNRSWRRDWRLRRRKVDELISTLRREGVSAEDITSQLLHGAARCEAKKVRGAATVKHEVGFERWAGMCLRAARYETLANVRPPSDWPRGNIAAKLGYCIESYRGRPAEIFNVVLFARLLARGGRVPTGSPVTSRQLRQICDLAGTWLTDEERRQRLANILGSTPKRSAKTNER
jgi:hypothetical protein